MTDPHAQAKKREAAETAAALTAVYTAAQADVLEQFDATGSIADLLSPKWRDLLRRRVRERSEAVVKAVSPDIEVSRVEGKLDAYADWFARAWDESTRVLLTQIDTFAPNLRQEVADVMQAVTDTAHLRADALSVEMGNFSAIEQATISGKLTKTWRTQGAYTRPEHLAISGATVPIGMPFPNGMQYPGAPAPPEQRVNCDCYLTFGG